MCPWDGVGNFSRSDGTRTGTTVWQDARDAPVKILAADHDTHDQDLADGIELCIAKNGENSPTLLVMGGIFKLEGNFMRLDADEDTYLDPSSDDILDIYVGAERIGRFQNDASISSKFEVRSNDADATQGPAIVTYRDSATPAAADLIGEFRFDGEDSGGNQTAYAKIGGEIVDPTDAAEYGQMNFYALIDGSLTEVMNISAFLKFGDSPGANSKVNFRASSGSVLTVNTSDATFSSDVVVISADRAANSGFDFLQTISDADGTPDAEHRLLGDGTSAQDGGTAWTTGAGFAEMFEWADGNPGGEDRCGLTVALEGAKIRPAAPGDAVIGVITGVPAGIGNAGALKWHGRYRRDKFGRRLRDATGRRITAPDFDPGQEYVSRLERPEWGCVSLLGQEIVRDGQPVDPRWIKMEQRADGVSLWLVR